MKKEIKQQLNDLKKELNNTFDFDFRRSRLKDNFLIFTDPLCTGTSYSRIISITPNMVNKIYKIFKTKDVEFILDINDEYCLDEKKFLILKIKNKIINL